MRTSKRPITPNEVKSQLMRRGFTLSKWGKKEGFHPRMVSKTIAKWTGRNNYTPTGEKTIKIIVGISQTIGFAIHPIAKPKESLS